jgi:hypothetical protein
MNQQADGKETEWRGPDVPVVDASRLDEVQVDSWEGPAGHPQTPRGVDPGPSTTSETADTVPRQAVPPRAPPAHLPLMRVVDDRLVTPMASLTPQADARGDGQPVGYQGWLEPATPAFHYQGMPPATMALGETRPDTGAFAAVTESSSGWWPRAAPPLAPAELAALAGHNPVAHHDPHREPAVTTGWGGPRPDPGALAAASQPSSVAPLAWSSSVGAPPLALPGLGDRDGEWIDGWSSRTTTPARGPGPQGQRPVSGRPAAPASGSMVWAETGMTTPTLHATDKDARNAIATAVSLTPHLALIAQTLQVRKSIVSALGGFDALKTKSDLRVRLENARSLAEALIKTAISKGQSRADEAAQQICNALAQQLGVQATLTTAAWLLVVLAATNSSTSCWLGKELRVIAEAAEQSCRLVGMTTPLGGRTTDAIPRYDVGPMLEQILSVPTLVEAINTRHSYLATAAPAAPKDSADLYTFVVGVEAVPGLAGLSLVECMRKITSLREGMRARRVVTEATSGLDGPALMQAIDVRTRRQLDRHYQWREIRNMHTLYDPATQLLIWDECRLEAAELERNRAEQAREQQNRPMLWAEPPSSDSYSSSSSSRRRSGSPHPKNVRFAKSRSTKRDGEKAQRGAFGGKRGSPAKRGIGSVYRHDHDRPEASRDTGRPRSEPSNTTGSQRPSKVCFNCGGSHLVSECTRKCRRCGSSKKEKRHFYTCAKPLDVRHLDERTAEFAKAQHAKFGPRK